ncbi:Asp-tRNA(Asn)/Glu-tRNA(Gln) amidotransferase subunit GatB [Marinilactibacillus psychrotolerans]|uniref:Aspartyl/glutamyl-tRNA(Asn/Gln) amidotransferase subunit B n=2 Tax=Marinilactibacillus psychrotolerans TaxID=191770 RepID=A0A511H1Y2_9LACT|nr:Asp-tRNA(Asn)/Glu-tRNA(Gln) amidotransferase subunit GatB [Marinilactibacillus psychrotolerans]TLQ07222.1 Asp-tRNA(Asn)/Glu-tRNA(Gln) amidotransferase subunit GatB [Marinilactibacillus psychrotolerans]SDC97265.1 aspartyl/glutamyl-tRNA(Asn/Gln) amidotransferase subunit B [Marinilactibacillus psychrotolerans]SJN28953.1 Aspartyl-tRNA(Asn) amidotransferase subunit B amidotransferase subunit B [Marinilactibacillus psychrotolerans 42ea]GEL67541.1 aspartyl/glutamyl-tRNA(Asn/Gln) amidotransferase su
MNFETIIGLEIHVELKTNSKMFSPSPAHFGAEPNTNTNVIDWGYPGVLPVVNERAIEFGMKAALALNCTITQDTKFDRKNYFYPDNPKAYQISQFDRPIGHDGWIEIEVNGEKKKIRIERVHLEEDAGKNTHGSDGYSYVDLNRQGTPLIEIVSEADMRSPEEAYAYLEAVKQIVQFTGVSDVKMEEGSMRCDANISLRPFGQKEFGTKSELKNLNSFNFVRKGLAHEVERQERELIAGRELMQETRRYDETTGKTILMRVKEGSSDYRYFPEPDIPNLLIEDEWIEKVRQSLPEMPKERRTRYVEELGIPEYDAEVLTSSREMSDFFEGTVSHGADPKQVSNWLMGEVSAYLNSEKLSFSETALTPKALAEMINLIADGTISSKIAKKVFRELITNGSNNVEALVEEKGWAQLSDPSKLLPVINETLDQNEQSIEDYKNGRDRAIGFLVGQIMKKTRGQANPGVVNKLLKEEIEKR